MNLSCWHAVILNIFPIIILGINEAESTSVKSVQIIFRHGDRTADTSYVTTTGGLTQLGKKQMYELGLYIRKRYPNLLKTEFDPGETSIISSDTDRTIRSAGLVAYGLYEDFNSEANWKGGDDPIPFEPIPVRAIPKEIDRYLLQMNLCPRQDQLTVTTLTSYIDVLLEQHANLLEIYTDKMKDNNLKNRSIDIGTRILKFLSFCDQAEFNSTHGLSLKDWTTELLQQDDFRYLDLGIFKAVYKLHEVRKLYAGPLLELVTNGFQDENPKKMTLYAGHDEIMYVLMKLLDIYDPMALYPPGVGAALLFELHQVSRNGHQQEEYLKIFYKNDTHLEPEELEVPNCGHPCLLSSFLKNTKPLFPADYESECQAENTSDSTAMTSWVYSILGAIAVLCCFYLLRLQFLRLQEKVNITFQYSIVPSISLL